MSNASAGANPFREPEVFDVVVVAGDYLPGLVDVGGPKRVYKWDKKEGPGTTGDTMTFRGSRLSEFSLVITMWEEAQYDEWIAKAPALEPIPGNVTALDIYHPVLDLLKIRAIVIAEIGAPVHKGGGLWTVTIACDEYKPPPKKAATGTPAGSSSKGGSSGTSGSAPNANAAQEAEIQRLLAEAKKP